MSQFRDYESFWEFYLAQHSKRATRKLHAVGTTLGLLCLALSIVYQFWWGIPLAFVIGYAFAWVSHFFVEGNRPATFGHPWWSFVSDFRMLYRMLRHRL